MNELKTVAFILENKCLFKVHVYVLNEERALLESEESGNVSSSHFHLFLGSEVTVNLKRPGITANTVCRCYGTL